MCDHYGKNFVVNPTYPSKVHELLLQLSDKKATGLDYISSKLLRISAPVICTSIANIFYLLHGISQMIGS